MGYFEEVLDRRHNSFKVARMVNNKHFIDDGNTLAFTVADMCFPVMPEVTEAICEYLKENTLGYTFPIESYYEALDTFFKKYHKLEISQKEVLPFTGVMPMIDTIIKANTIEGDGIVIFTPVYPPFSSTVKNANRKLIDCPLINMNGHYTIDFNLFDELSKDENVKMLLFCSPHNPVGRVWSKDELQQLVDICKKNNLLIISDEIHSDITLYEHVHTPIVSLAPEITFTCTSPSKTFNLAGSNCANLIVKNSNLYGKLVDYNTKQPHSSVNALGLVACQAAYDHSEKWMNELKSLIEENYEYIVSRLSDKVRISPLEGTYLLWVDLSKHYSDDFDERLQKKNIFVNNGVNFGENGKGFIRINIACPQKYLVTLCDRLIEFIEE